MTDKEVRRNSMAQQQSETLVGTQGKRRPYVLIQIKHLHWANASFQHLCCPEKHVLYVTAATHRLNEHD